MEKRRKIGFLARMDTDVAGLSVTAGVSEKRAVSVAGRSATAGENERRTAFCGR